MKPALIIILLAFLLSGCNLLWAGGDPPVTATPVPTATPQPSPVPLQRIAPANAASLQVYDSVIVAFPFRLVWSLDSATLAVLGREGAFLFDSQTWTRSAFLITQRQEIFLDISPDGHTLALTLDQRSVELRDIPTNARIKMLLPPWFFSTAFFSPDGQSLVMLQVENPAADLWNIGEAEISQTVRGFPPGEQAWSASYPGSSGYLAWTSANAVQIIDLQTNFAGPVLRQEDAVTSLSLSPDGSLLASANAGQIIIWDARQGTLLARFDLPVPASALDFSPDGALLAAGAGGRLLLWQTGTWETAADLSLPNGSIISLAFAPDGKQIACGVSDGSVIFWGVR